MYAYFMGLVHKISIVTVCIEVLLGLQPAWPNLVTSNRIRTFRGGAQIVLGVQASLVIHGLGRKKEAGCGRALVS